MFSNKKLLFIISLICIAAFLFIYSDKPDVKSLSKTTGAAIPFSENNNQSINSIAVNPKQPQVELIDDISNDDYIVECDPASLIEEDSYFEIQQQYLKSLSNSTSQDRLLEYVLYAELPEGESRLDLLLEYNEKFTNNSLALMETVSLCTYSSNNKCTKSFIDAAIASDKENGAMWLQSVLFFASRGNDEGVINSISELAKTSLFNEKYGERIKLYAQSLAGSNATDFHTNVVSGIGIEAARVIGYSHIFGWCKDGLDEINKASACLNLGRNLEKRSKTSISQLIGIAIQQLIHKAESDTELYQLLEKEREKLSKPMMNKQFYKASSLMSHDEKLLRNWLNNMDSIGEVESAKVLIEEAISLSLEKGIAVCTN